MQVGFGLGQVAIGQCGFGQYEVGFFGLGYADGACLGGAFFLEVFRVEEVQAGQGLEVGAVQVALYGAGEAVVAVKLYHACEVGRVAQGLVGILYSAALVAQAVAGACHEGVDEGAVLVVGGIVERFVEGADGQFEVFFPAHYVAPVLYGEGEEVFAGQQVGVAFDVVQVEALGVGSGLVGLCHDVQPLVGCFAQGAYVALQVGDVLVGVEYGGEVEHLAALRVVVEVVVHYSMAGAKVLRWWRSSLRERL